jgi:hypothetical protein
MSQGRAIPREFNASPLVIGDVLAMAATPSTNAPPTAIVGGAVMKTGPYSPHIQMRRNRQIGRQVKGGEHPGLGIIVRCLAASAGARAA